MAKAVSMVRQATSQASVFVGRIAQLIVDTGLWTVRVHDNATPGGFALLSSRNNLSDLGDIVIARNNLNLGSAALFDTTAFDVAGAAAAVLVSSLQKSANLSDVSNAGTARANLGLGSAALRGENSFFQVTNNLNECDPGTARGNLGLGSIATFSTGAFLAAANNLSELASASTARTNLGLGTAAVQNIGAFDAAGAAAAAQVAATAVANAAQATANAAAVKANNLSDLGNATAARQNLAFKSVISADLAITAGGTLTYNHAIGQQPSGIRYCLVCQTAEGFYSIGDVIDVVPGNTTTGAANRGFASRVTTANIFIQFGSASGGNVFAYTNNLGGDGFVLANANWRLRIYVTYIPVT